MSKKSLNETLYRDVYELLGRLSYAFIISHALCLQELKFFMETSLAIFKDSI